MINVANDIKFPCTKCGVCCTHLDRLPEWALSEDPKNPFYFPHDFDDTGKCSQLGGDHQCMVYENRPLICNLQKMKVFMNMDIELFNYITARNCNLLQEEAGVPINYRVKL